MDNDKHGEADQRGSDRRVAPDPDYAGPERREGERRKDERRKRSD